VVLSEGAEFDGGALAVGFTQAPLPVQAQVMQVELTERVCLLVANMASGGLNSKQALVAAGVLPHLMRLLSDPDAAVSDGNACSSGGEGDGGVRQLGEGGTLLVALRTQRLRRVAAAAAAFSNLTLHAPHVSQQAVAAGALPALQRLITPHRAQARGLSMWHAVSALPSHVACGPLCAVPCSLLPHSSVCTLVYSIEGDLQ
jgi:hypothetical protein